MSAEYTTSVLCHWLHTCVWKDLLKDLEILLVILDEHFVTIHRNCRGRQDHFLPFLILFPLTSALLNEIIYLGN